MRRLARCALVVSVTIGLSGAPLTASGDVVDKVGKDLGILRTEIDQMASAIRAPRALTTNRGEVTTGRLVSAQVALGLGNYDDAAIMLFDIVERADRDNTYVEALYYLAEALFQKKDNVGARKYFRRVVDEHGSSGPFYQQALQRLVELSLKVEDESVADYLRALDSIPRAKQRPSVPYVRGRYLFFSEQYSRATTAFREIPAQSEYYIRARYFLGASHIALGELGPAAEVFQELTRADAKSPNDKRVVELSHVAMGRLYYERDQPSRAIDSYLMVSRKSDLFDEALYEVAWVYVKDKRYERALRALELLALAAPDSARIPDVRILEGNLRIRKAQALTESGSGNSLEEYDKAMAVFESTRDTFEGPRNELERIVAEQADPSVFVQQLTGLGNLELDTATQLPPIAMQYLREEPQVRRVAVVGVDLHAIRRDIEESERTIFRLERTVNSPSAVNVFPELAKKRTRLVEVTERTLAHRAQLHDAEWKLVARYAAADQQNHYQALQSDRVAAGQSLDEQPNAGLAYGERITQAREDYTDLDKRGQELAVLIDSADATLLAVSKYLTSLDATALPAKQRREYEVMLEELRGEVADQKAELAALRGDVTLARDQAGQGDRAAAQNMALRQRYAAAIEAERIMLAKLAQGAAGGDRGKIGRIEDMLASSSAILAAVETIDREIDGIIDVGLAEVRTALAEEKQELASYSGELSRYTQQARVVGGTVLAENFGAVSKKFYEILIRADVGVVDVSWATKEEAEDTVKRLTLEQSRERRLLEEQFGDISRSPPAGTFGATDTAPQEGGQ